MKWIRGGAVSRLFRSIRSGRGGLGRLLVGWRGGGSQRPQEPIYTINALSNSRVENREYSLYLFVELEYEVAYVLVPI
jgi:hypothetical protein